MKILFMVKFYLFIDGSDSKILSKGHRVIQGLNVDDNNILATEHGPRGEMRLIKFWKMEIMDGQ